MYRSPQAHEIVRVPGKDQVSPTTGVEQRAFQARADFDARHDRCPGEAQGSERCHLRSEPVCSNA